MIVCLMVVRCCEKVLNFEKFACELKGSRRKLRAIVIKKYSGWDVRKHLVCDKGMGHGQSCDVRKWEGVGSFSESVCHHQGVFMVT